MQQSKRPLADLGRNDCDQLLTRPRRTIVRQSRAVKLREFFRHPEPLGLCLGLVIENAP
jgi:hypothetical protein